jgi:hypothetical protein
MIHRGTVTILASAVLSVLAAGCAGQPTGAAPNLSSSAAAVTTSQLRGTWRGESWAVGTDSTSVLNRDLVLEIKDDATYRFTSARAGAGGGSNDSGVAVAERDAVVLRSSTGQSMRLKRDGDTLYGVTNSGGRSMHIMLERTR